MAAVYVDAVVAQRRAQPLRVLAVRSRQQLLVLQVLEAEILAVGEGMPPVDDELKVLREKRPGIEPFPFFVDLGRDAELGFALLEKFRDFPAVAAQEVEFQTVE